MWQANRHLIHRNTTNNGTKLSINEDMEILHFPNPTIRIANRNCPNPLGFFRCIGCPVANILIRFQLLHVDQLTH